MVKRVGLRIKVYLLVVPLVVVVVIASGALASLASRTALTGIATRLMAYKAEQLRDYAQSEWEVITELGLEDEEGFRSILEASMQSYATSLLRSETEWIFALDAEGEIAMSAGFRGTPPWEDARELDAAAAVAEPGWFEDEILGEQRVGVAFDFEPFGWTVAVSELERTFFREVENIGRTHAVILVVSVLVVTTLISVFVAVELRPIERLTAAIRHVGESNDFSRRVAVEFSDEVGILAHEFNVMIDSLRDGYEQLQEKTRAESEARQIAVEREEETLLLLGRASEYRDEATGEHLKRVGALCALIVRLVGGSADEQELIRRSSPLHDIGKIGVPDHILRKSGALTPEENEQMRAHTIIGYSLLKDAKSIYLVDGAEIALTHHERWDGTGYPSQLSGNEIPLSGRVVGLVDVFDALTSTRPYKRAWSAEEAGDYILNQRGKHFDPQLVDLFEEHFTELRELGRLWSRRPAERPSR